MHCRSLSRVSHALATATVTLGVVACSSQQEPIPQRVMPTAQARTMLDGAPEPGNARVFFYLGRTVFIGPYGSRTERESDVPTILVIADTRVGGVNRNDVLVIDVPAGEYEVHWVEQRSQGEAVTSLPQRMALLPGTKVFLAAMVQKPGPYSQSDAWIEPQPIYGPSIAAWRRPVFPTSGLSEAPPPAP